jgi:hypothetical protein
MTSCGTLRYNYAKITFSPATRGEPIHPRQLNKILLSATRNGVMAQEGKIQGQS